MLVDYAIGGIAATGAGFFSNPLDVVKTRLQLQGELRKRGQHVVHYRGVFHGLCTIVKNDGVLALQKGIIPALSYQFLYNGLRLGIYQTLDDGGYTLNQENKPVLINQIVCAAIAGGVAASFACPFYVIRTQLQSSAAVNIAVGHQHHHAGLYEAINKSIRRYGVLGLWGGVSTTATRSMVSAATSLPTFGQAKQYLRNKDQYFVEHPLVCAFIASLVGGLVMAICLSPFDVMATRVTNQDRDAQGRGLLYRNMFDCAIKIWRAEGLLGFYKGFKACYIRSAPHSLLMLVFWDKLKLMKESYYQSQ